MKGMLKIYFLSLGLVLLCGWSVYFWQSRNGNNKVEQGVEPTTESNFNPITKKDFLEIETIFQEIADGNLKFNDKIDGVDLYHSEYFDLQQFFSDPIKPAYLSVYAYKYRPGGKYLGGYEGSEYLVDMDQWKLWLTNLKIGKNTVRVLCDGVSGCTQLEKPVAVIAKKFGQNVYQESGGYFPPSMTYSRSYTTFEPKNKVILSVRIDYPDEDSLTTRGLFSKIEDLLP